MSSLLAAGNESAKLKMLFDDDSDSDSDSPSRLKIGLHGSNEQLWKSVLFAHFHNFSVHYHYHCHCHCQYWHCHLSSEPCAERKNAPRTKWVPIFQSWYLSWFPYTPVVDTYPIQCCWGMIELNSVASQPSSLPSASPSPGTVTTTMPLFVPSYQPSATPTNSETVGASNDVTMTFRWFEGISGVTAQPDPSQHGPP